MKYKENTVNPNNTKLKDKSYNIKNFIPNGKTNKKIDITSLINKKLISVNSSKLLSIPESQYQTQIYEPSEIEVTNENKNILYIKKTKSDANLLDTKSKKANYITRNKKLSGGINNIKFTKNKKLVCQTIKEYYKKDDNYFKNYLKTINNESTQTKKYQENFNISPSYNSNKNIILKEIYKKPISNMTYNIIHKDKVKENEGNKNYNNFLGHLCIPSSVRKEKINCTKMINNNGIKKNIFNIINNYSTKTIKNDSKKSNFKIKNKNKANIFNKDKNNFEKKINQSCKNMKSINPIKPISIFIDNDDIYNNTNINITKNMSTINNFTVVDDNIKENEMTQNNILNSINKKRQIYLKYSKKNVKIKKADTERNYINKELSKTIVEKDFNTFKKIKNEKNGKDKKILKGPISMKDIKINEFFNKNFFCEKDNLNNTNKKKKLINTDIKKNYFSLTLENILKKDNQINKSFSYSNENDDNTNKNGNEYQNGKSNSPLYKKPNKNLITKEIVFSGGVNTNKNNSYYNSDDDIMNSNNNSKSTGINNNSFDNRINNNFFTNNYHVPYSNSNNNIFTKDEKQSPIKDYYFNYLSNKINNDLLNENKFNKLDKNLFSNKKIYCEKCKKNYYKYCSNFYKKISPLTIYHSKSISMNNFDKNFLKENNIEKNDEKNKLRSSNVDLKLDI